MPHTERKRASSKPESSLSRSRRGAVGMDAKSVDDMTKDFIQMHEAIVPYVSQSYSWDCGLACVEMALRSRGVKKASFRDLRKMCSTDSVWSIDIAYLLRRYRIDTVFYTVTKGVRPEYRKQEFYKDQLPEDTKRVTELFFNAEKEGVRVIQRPVLLSEIREAVYERKNLVLVLMDKRLLKCSLCDRSTFSSRSLFPSRGSPGFLGHYVLLYAYDPTTDKFLMKDPAAVRETCVISADVLEEARLAFGTDQDILFIGDVEGEPDPGVLLQRTNGS